MPENPANPCAIGLHNFFVMRGNYFRLVPGQGLYYDQRIAFSMLACRACGATKEVPSPEEAATIIEAQSGNDPRSRAHVAHEVSKTLHVYRIECRDCKVTYEAVLTYAISSNREFNRCSSCSAACPNISKLTGVGGEPWRIG